MHFGTFTPAQRIFRDAATARQALASQWLSAAQVSQGLALMRPTVAIWSASCAALASSWGSTSRTRRPSYRYPAWQFLPSRPRRCSVARLHPRFWPRIPAEFCGPRMWSFRARPDGAADALQRLAFWLLCRHLVAMFSLFRAFPFGPNISTDANFFGSFECCL